ncbi:MAG TPA: hypothetical protein VF819_08315, partial [Nitrospira sp.]
MAVHVPFGKRGQPFDMVVDGDAGSRSTSTPARLRQAAYAVAGSMGVVVSARQCALRRTRRRA